LNNVPPATDQSAPIELSIVVPALNEQDNVSSLVEEIRKAVIDGAGIVAEVIIVDDGSTDQTPQRLGALGRKYPWLRALRRERSAGQSAAMHAGIQAARGAFIATLDADLQNDPADLPVMLGMMREGQFDLVQGDRSMNRRDNLIRRIGSVVGRAARRWLLGDSTRDTGCSARIVRAEIARQFPLQFRGMHRFLPAYARMLGARIIECPVHHHPRAAGRTKYGLGLVNRGWAGLIDCLAVRWMLHRYRQTHAPPMEDDRS